MLSKGKTALLLNRSLSSVEDTNFALYLEIATTWLESLLCMDLSSSGDTATARKFPAREGYSTLFTDIFTELTSVSIDGTEVESTKYAKMQNDKYSGSWYNSIVFDSRKSQCVVEVTAKWGFAADAAPADLLFLLAQLFVLVGIDQTTDRRVKSKKVEDFSVVYKDSPAFNELVDANVATINKYGNCSVGEIRHGSVRTVRC